MKLRKGYLQCTKREFDLFIKDYENRVEDDTYKIRNTDIKEEDAIKYYIKETTFNKWQNKELKEMFPTQFIPKKKFKEDEKVFIHNIFRLLLALFIDIIGIIFIVMVFLTIENGNTCVSEWNSLLYFGLSIAVWTMCTGIYFHRTSKG